MNIIETSLIDNFGFKENNSLKRMAMYAPLTVHAKSLTVQELRFAW